MSTGGATVLPTTETKRALQSSCSALAIFAERSMTHRNLELSNRGRGPRMSLAADVGLEGCSWRSLAEALHF
jgi:hypothetical protein